MKQVKQVVMLPTEKANRLILFESHNGLNDKLHLEGGDIRAYAFGFQHIYFTDNSEIKEGDWFYTENEDSIIGGGEIQQCIGVNKGNIQSDLCFSTQGAGYHPSYVSKIVASTDKEITPNSWIREDFVKKYIEMYNAGTPITEVNVEYSFTYKRRGVLDCPRIYFPKTRQDGSVIISPSRLYTEDEMKRSFDCGRNFQVTGENNFKELLDSL